MSTPTWLSWLTNSASGFTCKYCHISWSSPHPCDYLGLQMLLLALLANLFSASYNYRTISLQPSGFPQVQRLDHTLTCFSNKLSLKKKKSKKEQNGESATSCVARHIRQWNSWVKLKWLWMCKSIMCTVPNSEQDVHWLSFDRDIFRRFKGRYTASVAAPQH